MACAIFVAKFGDEQPRSTARRSHRARRQTTAHKVLGSMGAGVLRFFVFPPAFSDHPTSDVVLSCLVLLPRSMSRVAPRPLGTLPKLDLDQAFDSKEVNGARRPL